MTGVFDPMGTSPPSPRSDMRCELPVVSCAGTETELTALEVGGNRIVNSIFEGRISFETARPDSGSDPATRDAFTVQKYVEKRWYNPSAVKSFFALSRNSWSNHGGVAQVELRACSSDTVPKMRGPHAAAAAAAGGGLSSSSHHKPRRQHHNAEDSDDRPVGGHGDDTNLGYGHTGAGRNYERAMSGVSTASGTSQRRKLARRSSMPSSFGTMEEDDSHSKGFAAGGGVPLPPPASRTSVGRSPVMVMKKPSSFSATKASNSSHVTGSRNKPRSAAALADDRKDDQDDKIDDGFGIAIKASTASGGRTAGRGFSFDDSFASFGCDSEEKEAWWESNNFFPSAKSMSDDGFFDGFSEPIKSPEGRVGKPRAFRLPSNASLDQTINDTTIANLSTQMPIRTKSLEGAMSRRSRRFIGDALSTSMHGNAPWNDPPPAPLRRQGDPLRTAISKSPIRERDIHSVNPGSGNSRRRMINRQALTPPVGRRSSNRSLMNDDDGETVVTQGTTRTSALSRRPARTDAVKAQSSHSGGPDDVMVEGTYEEHPTKDCEVCEKSTAGTGRRSCSSNSGRSLVTSRADARGTRKNSAVEGSDPANCMRRSRRRETMLRNSSHHSQSSSSLPTDSSHSFAPSDHNEGQEVTAAEFVPSYHDSTNPANLRSRRDDLGSNSSHERRRRRTANVAISPKRVSSRDKLRTLSPKRHSSHDAVKVSASHHRHRSRSSTGSTRNNLLPNSLRNLPSSSRHGSEKDTSDGTATTCSSLTSQDPEEFSKKLAVASLYANN